MVETVAKKFDKFSNDPVFAQHLNDPQNKIGSGDALVHFASKPDPDNFRDQHGNGLAEHGGLGFNAPDPPAQNGKPVDHYCVAIGANQRIGIGIGFAVNVGGPDGF